ncbi:MAG: glycoside hydrolase family 88 protein [Polyangia bacterium]
MCIKAVQKSCFVAALLLALGAATGCSSGGGSPGTTGGNTAGGGGAGQNSGGSAGVGGAGAVARTTAATAGATTSSSAGGSVATGGASAGVGGAATSAGGTVANTGGAATSAGGTVANTGGAATGGALGGTVANTGGAATGGAVGGTASSSAPGGATGGGKTGGTTGSTGGAATGGRTGGTAGSLPAGGTTAGGGTSSAAGSGGGGAAGGSTLIGGPGPAAQLITQTGTDWGKLVIDSTIAGKTSFGSTYPEGLILHGMYQTYKRLKVSSPTDATKYLTFITTSADQWGVADGSSLDNIMHMAALCDAYEATQKASYKGFADSTRRIFDTYPTVPPVNGAFWHANNGTRDYQLWGDGVYMSLSFLTRYATVFNDPTVYPIAENNLTITASHLKNSATGLFWHAYDDSGKATWAQPTTKSNQISWGRAMGWFSLASIMTLEMLPANDPGRAQIQSILTDLLTAVATYQDSTTGRWFQVVDMGTNAQDWVETSCSSMYSYAIWWAYQHGLLDASYAAVATKGFNGVMQMVTKNATNTTTIAKICTGLNASAAVTDYFSHPSASNDQHGIGSFLLMWEGMQ